MNFSRRSITACRRALERFGTADMGWFGFTLFVFLFQTCLATGIGALVVGGYLWNGIYILAGLVLLNIAYRLHRRAMRLFGAE